MSSIISPETFGINEFAQAAGKSKHTIYLHHAAGLIKDHGRMPLRFTQSDFDAYFESAGSQEFYRVLREYRKPKIKSKRGRKLGPMVRS